MADNNLEIMNLSLKEITRYVNECEKIMNNQKEDIISFRDVIINVKDKSRIFVGGNGRSGFVARFFAMRLMHLGFKVYVLGESIVDSIRDDDVLIIISNSGDKDILPEYILKRSVNIKLLSVCGDSNCYLNHHSTVSIIIEKLSDIKRSQTDIIQLNSLNFNEDDLTVMGTAFELSALVILDSLIIELMYKLKTSHNQMKMRHDNLVKRVMMDDLMTKNKDG